MVNGEYFFEIFSCSPRPPSRGGYGLESPTRASGDAMPCPPRLGGRGERDFLKSHKSNES